MEPEFITFQKFSDSELANNLAGLLAKHSIPYELEEDTQVFDPAFILNNPALKDYAVKIRGGDFDRANQVLMQEESIDINEVEKDYYLFGFTDEELMEVLVKADEWSAFDNVLARKILTERGKAINEETITRLNEKRIAELRTAEPPQTSWIIIGYIAALAGGIFGIFIGWHLYTYKKTLPDGERVFDYSENDRSHGQRIFDLSIIIFVIALIYKLTLVLTAD
jgi:hypothetical protein